MAQTAVSWYNEQLNMYGDKAFNKEITLGEYHIKKQELLEQSKEMEKAQIIDAATWGALAETGEQYYNEKYNK